jgi:hypothetical protein
MLRSLLRRGFIIERRLFLEMSLPFSSFVGDSAFASGITPRDFGFTKTEAGAFFSSRPQSFDRPSSNDIQKNRSLYGPFRNCDEYASLSVALCSSFFSLSL